MKFTDHSLMAGPSTTTGYMHVRDEKPSGTSPASGNGGWQVRELNTVKTNTIVGASLSSNSITLPAGSYYVRARFPTTGSVNKVSLKNATDASNILIGNSINAQTDLWVYGKFTLTAQKVIQLMHYNNATASLGNIASLSGYVEVYAEVEIWKEA